MGNTPRDDQTVGDRSVDASTRTVASTIGRRATFIGDLLRHARLRSRKDPTGEHVGDVISPRGRSPGHASEAARSSVDAGITRGSSLLFGRFSSRR
jgi:hypothetical protein